MGNVRMRAEQINYGATNVKAALDDLDPAALIDLNNRMNRIDAWKDTVDTEEKTGAYVEYPNALALNAVAVSADITSVQDLHGYDKPWVGGAGKNKLAATVSGIKSANTDGTWSDNTYTLGPMTVEILIDESNNVMGVKINGTPGSTFMFSFPGFDASGDYVLSGCPSGGGEDTYRLDLIGTGGGVIAQDRGSGATASNVNANVKGLIRIGSGTVCSNLIFTPMLRLATVTDATFEPYTNICPITGFSSVVITDVDAQGQTATVTVALGSTVYGGSLDLTSGELIIDKGMVDIGTLTWDYALEFNRFTTRSVIDDIKAAQLATTDDLICSALKTDPAPVTLTDVDNCICSYSNKRLYAKCSLYTSGTDFATAMNGQKVVYTLATPTTTTLTAAQLALVAGYNKLAANTGNITVEAYTGAAWGGDEA